MIGNAIVVTSPHGRKIEGYLNGSDLLPGMVMEQDPTVPADEKGTLTFRKATPGSDGGAPNGPLYILDMNMLAGGDAEDEYSDGDWGFLWCPNIGDVLNVRVSAPGTGTGDSVASGTRLIIDNGTGLFIETASTPDAEPFITVEDIDDVEATGTLVGAQFSGY